MPLRNKAVKSGSSPASGFASSGVDFNINHYVHVRLTPHGRECLRKNYDELAGFYGGKLTWEFRLPDEDAEGWSKWQMHDLMDALGKYVGMGRELPFETNIRIELPRQNDQVSQNRGAQGVASE